MTIELKPIRSAAQLKAALKELDRLWGAKRGTPDGDRFEVLALLIEDYESSQPQITDGPIDPIEAITFCLEQRGLERKALEPAIGTRARVSEIMSRKRPLTLAMIRKLNEMFDIPVDILVQAPIKAKSAARAKSQRMKNAA